MSDKKVKNKMPERETAEVVVKSGEPVVNIVIDEKAPPKPQPGEPTNRKEAEALVKAYHANCVKFPARLPKWEAKKEVLEKWVKSFK
ncbi:hypothetical protein KKF61_07525 [Patescibacteria group bacterium]|nr:hypothetical protein [Patescibacteria group bacterium]